MTAQPVEPVAPEIVKLAIEWETEDGLPFVAANQLLVQVDTAPSGEVDHVLLTFGHVAPPPVTGSPEQQMELVRANPVAVARAQARISVSVPRLLEMVALLQRLADDLRPARDGDADAQR